MRIKFIICSILLATIFLCCELFDYTPLPRDNPHDLNAPDLPSSMVTGVNISLPIVEIIVGEDEIIQINIEPVDAVASSVVWSSSDTSIATVLSTGVVTGISTGSVTLTVTVYAGDYTFTDSCTVNIVAQPVTIISPVDGQNIKGNVLLKAEVINDIIVQSLIFYLDETEISTDDSAPYEIIWDSNSIPDNSYEFKAIAVDSVGNELESKTNNVVVSNNEIDSILPIVSINSPADSSDVSGVQLITASASDDTAVFSVDFYINDTLVFTDYILPYEYSWNTAEESDSSIEIRVNATDGSGNSSDDVHNVTIDGSVAIWGSATWGNFVWN